MVIKSKKWKSSVGFLAFFLSVSFLLAGIANFAVAGYDMKMSDGDSKKNYRALEHQDYQDQGEFENYISTRLQWFLAMACGDYVDNHFYMTDYAAAYDTEVTYNDEAAVIEAIAGEAFYVDEEQDETQYSELSPKEEADRFHRSIQFDKNLLYRISYDGEVKYTNMEGIDWNGQEEHLPEGYNFYLQFDGSRVTVIKDGKSIDIYGDGIYRDDGSCWYVPGYKNLTGKEKWSKAGITILAAKDPVLYVNGYWDDKYYGGDGELYYMNRRLQDTIKLFRRAQMSVVCFVPFFIIYIIFRREKRMADQAIAKVTKKCWFEIKLLIFILVPIIVFTFSGFRTNVLPMIRESAYMYEREYDVMEPYVIEGGRYITDIMSYLLPELLRYTLPMLIVFWLIYFFVNDVVRNKPVYQNGITAKLLSAYQSREAELPMAKKIIHRALLVFVLSVLLLFALLVLGVCCLNLYRGVSQIAIAMEVSGIIAAVFLIFAEYWMQKKNKRLGLELEQLSEEISDIRNGNYTKGKYQFTKDSDLYDMAKELEEIRDGMEYAVEERMKSEHMKVELVTNVSHDIKTPLTSIISYIKLLKQEQELPDYVKDYVRILDEKSERLNHMVQDVFSVSKAASGQLAVENKELDFVKLLEQTLADMQEQIKESPVTLKTEFPPQPVMVLADGQRMYRVFQNLIGNALKYSLEGSRVYLTVYKEGASAAASIRSTSKEELREDIDFTERFLRGDKSRTDGGSGLGLSIAKSFTEACGGRFQIEIIADLFVVTVTLPQIT